MRVTERKQDTRHKIQLGGLIVKAGLGEEDKALILGILLEAKKAMETSKIEKSHFLAIGKSAFEQHVSES
jgi:hypothetical protein